MSKNKINDDIYTRRTDHAGISKKIRRRNISILIFIFLVIYFGGHLYFFNYSNINNVENTNVISESTISKSKSTEPNLVNTQNVATEELENNYTDEDIEFARVVVNVGQAKNLYTLENVKKNKIAIVGKKQNDGRNFITIMENGQDNTQTNMHLFYIPLGEGYIEHAGIRKYTTPANSSMAKIYLETKYDNIALEILKNSSDSTNNQVFSEVNEKMDVASILNGDYRSIAGTWKNGEGKTLIINADGMTDDGQIIKINPSQNIGGMITGGIGIEGQPGGAGISFLDTGVSFPNIEDHSDITKTRIIITQQVGEFPAEAYYYKILD